MCNVCSISPLNHSSPFNVKQKVPILCGFRRLLACRLCRLSCPVRADYSFIGKYSGSGAGAFLAALCASGCAVCFFVQGCTRRPQTALCFHGQLQCGLPRRVVGRVVRPRQLSRVRHGFAVAIAPGRAVVQRKNTVISLYKRPSEAGFRLHKYANVLCVRPGSTWH